MDYTEEDVLREIDERDRATEWADRLAGAIARATGAEIGEHSNMNDPWSNALEAIEAAAGRLLPADARSRVERWIRAADERAQRDDETAELNAHYRDGMTRVLSELWPAPAGVPVEPAADDGLIDTSGHGEGKESAPTGLSQKGDDRDA